MFGKNVLLKQVHTFPGTYWVQEVFATIQGEGPLTGMPAVFIRMAGCNLRCHFCDTDFESSKWNPTLTELGEKIIDARNAKWPPPITLAVLTGGEPMRQPLGPLVGMLMKMGMRVQIETAGTLWDETLDVYADRGEILFVCSPKTGVLNRRLVTHCDDYKYIVSAARAIASDDGLPLESTQVAGNIMTVARPPVREGVTTWVQPETAYIQVAGGGNIVNPAQTERNTQHAVDLCMRHGYRLSLQTHRILGLP